MKTLTKASMSILCVALLTSGAFASEVPNRRHVVVIVWDGMRPDFVSEENTPTLWKLARDGVTFRSHHSVYPSATIVNGTALVTGVYPDRSGILANHVYRAELDAKKSIDVEAAQVVRKADKLSGDKYVAAPTIAELLREHGKQTAIATAKTVGLLLDRHLRSGAGQNIFAGESLSADAIASIVKTLGAFPSALKPAERDAWTTKALTDFLWRDEIPAFSLLWLSEPDDTEHRTAPGAPAAISAMKSSDENLARVLAALDRSRAGGTRSTTDVFIVSDHGFSTIERSIDLRKILKDAGFDAVTEFAGEARNGQIMLVGNGGTVLFYVIGHNASVARRLVEFLEQSDFTGVIFTKEPMEGTFTLDQGKIDPPSPGYGVASNEHAPDVVMSFRWNENKNQFGVPGMIDADWQRAAGKGTHATLSRFDMHNILIAAGRDFQRGQVDDLPSGNVDLAPTILQILGIAPPHFMDGRVLSEVMLKSAGRTDSSRGETDTQPSKPETETIEGTRTFSSGVWQQTLRITRVGSTIYLDEGNGIFRPNKSKEK